MPAKCKSRFDAPTPGEVDAAERVLADAHSQPADGYWRDLARECLEAAQDAKLREALGTLDEMIDEDEPSGTDAPNRAGGEVPLPQAIPEPGTPSPPVRTRRGEP